MRAETAICLIVFIWAEKSLLEKIEQAFCESLSLFSSAILQTKIELSRALVSTSATGAIAPELFDKSTYSGKNCCIKMQ